jgi:hypothetical protein
MAVDALLLPRAVGRRDVCSSGREGCFAYEIGEFLLDRKTKASSWASFSEVSTNFPCVRARAPASLPTVTVDVRVRVVG